MLEPDGSNVAEVLWQLRDQEVEFVQQDDTKLTMPLPEMTDYVLQTLLNLRQPVKVEQVAKDILEIRVGTLGPEPFTVTLSDVGLGYNQILPVVVQGLLTPPGGLVILEQPEIHLHPDVQAKLVTFFAGLAKSDRRVLIETHSSHIIEHLCLAIAQDKTDWLAKNAQVLFVHAPDQEHPSARIEPVDITPYGEILNWPPHFLPDIAELDEKIIRAAFAKQEADARSSQ
jgi:predicted ATPase